MNYELREFQATAVRELASRLDAARHGYRRGAGQNQAVELTAPTGAGKTIIATALIERLIFGSDDDDGALPDPGAVFLWMTDLPQLNEQTQGKMLDASSLLGHDRLIIMTNTFAEETLQGGHVYFLNTQLLGENARLAAPDPIAGRPFSFWDVVRRTAEHPDRTLYLVVDEAHRGMTETRKIEEANSIIQRFIKGIPGIMPAVPIVLGISATPEPFERVIAGSGRTFASWEVPSADVRASGLIKERTATDYAGERQRDAMALFAEAVRAWRSSTERWAAYYANYGASGGDPLVVPALIVQVENEAGRRVTATDLDAVLRIIGDIVGPLPDAAFVHSFGDPADLLVGSHTIRYLAPSRIAEDTTARVIFYKTSLGTGWDCPRAEVMFSFRRAVDPTSIAQTIGRMVRTPLARRIEEDERLNSVDVFLPHYDRTAVDRVIAKLRETGGAAVADTIESRASLISVPLRPDAGPLVAALEQVTSHVVPTVRSRQEVRRLWDLARSLAKHGIALDAFREEIDRLAAALEDHRTAIAADPIFLASISDSGTITVGRSVYDWLNPEAPSLPDDVDTFDIPASDESIGRLWASAKSRLSGELATAWAKLRLSSGEASLNAVRLEAAALASRTDVIDDLNALASTRIDALMTEYGSAIDRLPPARQEPYRRVRRAAPEPSHVPLRLPAAIEIRRGHDAWPKHLYADPSGMIELSLGSSWETDILHAVLANPSVVGWLRNLPRNESVLCVPWLKDNAWHPFYPDLLLVRRDSDRLVVDILDPHDYTRPDAVEKAKGLSMFARDHGANLGHIDLIAEVENAYHTLHMEREHVRADVDKIVSLDALRLLYLQAPMT